MMKRRTRAVRVKIKREASKFYWGMIDTHTAPKVAIKLAAKRFAVSPRTMYRYLAA